MKANSNGARQTNERSWRCIGCGLLLGIHRGGELHIKYKELEAVVVGRFRTACRRCTKPNETTAMPASDAAFTAA
jgi:hypothetical protein